MSGRVSAAHPTVSAGGHGVADGQADGAGPAGGAGAAVLSMDAAAALVALGSSRRGLSEDEAARRRAATGPNTLPRPRRRSVAAELAAQLANMFAVVLMVAAGLTFLIYFLSSPRDTANLYLAFGILGVVALNALIGFVQEHAAERTAEALQAMVPHTARVLRGGEQVDAAEFGSQPGGEHHRLAGAGGDRGPHEHAVAGLGGRDRGIRGLGGPPGRQALPGQRGHLDGQRVRLDQPGVRGYRVTSLQHHDVAGD